MATHNPKPPLRTYSKRVLKDSHEPPVKRQCVDVLKVLENTPASVVLAAIKNKKISDFFTPASLSSSPSSTVSSVFSSDLAPDRNDSPPSSPPSREQSPPRFNLRKRTRRRLTTRPLLPPKPKMSDYTSATSERRRARRVTVDKAIIEGGLRENVDPAIFRPVTPDEKVMARTMTHTQIAREDAYPKGSFNRDDGRERSASITHNEEVVEKIICGIEPPTSEQGGGSTGSPDSEPDADVDETAKYPGAIDVPSSSKPTVLVEAPKEKTVPGLPKKPLGHYIDGKFVQTQLDLGAAHMIMCADCGTFFNKTDQFDVRYHNERHEAFIDGVPIKGLKVLATSGVRKVYSRFFMDGIEECVVIVDRNSHQKWKDLAMDVLEDHVDVDLGCKPTTDDYLWMTIPDPELRVDEDEATYRNLNQLQTCNDNTPRVLRFQVYLYIADHRVISALVAERIAKASELYLEQIVKDEFGDFPGEVVQTVPTVKNLLMRKALLGINKIWTLPKYRRQGFASHLVRAARVNSIPGRRIWESQVAWTHTTELGALMAKNINSSPTVYAWLSYVEQADRFE